MVNNWEITKDGISRFADEARVWIVRHPDGGWPFTIYSYMYRPAGLSSLQGGWLWCLMGYTACTMEIVTAPLWEFPSGQQDMIDPVVVSHETYQSRAAKFLFCIWVIGVDWKVMPPLLTGSKHFRSPVIFHLEPCSVASAAFRTVRRGCGEEENLGESRDRALVTNH